jgi:hypothetical protein
MGSVGDQSSSTTVVENCVALNGEVSTSSGTVSIGRVIGQIMGTDGATHTNNYANSTMTLTGGTVTAATTDGKDGADVTVDANGCPTGGETWWTTASPSGPGWSLATSASAAETAAASGGSPWWWDSSKSLPKLYWE